MRMIKWLISEAYEKINLPAAYRKLKELGKQHGRRFFIAALLWELVEDIVFPALAWFFGAPELIPVFLVLHFEPIVYPAFFWGFRTYDRVRGIAPWEPSRSAQSSHWRSAMKVFAFQLVVAGWLSHLLGWKPLGFFLTLTSAFGFIHERIWHDTNYGILLDDTVQVRRIFSKTGTYLLVCSMTLLPILRLSHDAHLWLDLVLIQAVNGFLYVVMETIWARSLWGVIKVTEMP